jgi:hypothetical protein
MYYWVHKWIQLGEIIFSIEKYNIQPTGLDGYAAEVPDRTHENFSFTFNMVPADLLCSTLWLKVGNKFKCTADVIRYSEFWKIMMENFYLGGSGDENQNEILINCFI